MVGVLGKYVRARKEVSKRQEGDDGTGGCAGTRRKGGGKVRMMEGGAAR